MNNPTQNLPITPPNPRDGLILEPVLDCEHLVESWKFIIEKSDGLSPRNKPATSFAGFNMATKSLLHFSPQKRFCLNSDKLDMYTHVPLYSFGLPNLNDHEFKKSVSPKLYLSDDLSLKVEVYQSKARDLSQLNEWKKLEIKTRPKTRKLSPEFICRDRDRLYSEDGSQQSSLITLSPVARKIPQSSPIEFTAFPAFLSSRKLLFDKQFKPVSPVHNFENWGV